MATSAKIESHARRPLATAEEATELGLDVTGLDQWAIHSAVQQERGRRWGEEHREAIAGWSKWAEENGLPLARYRMF